MLQHSPALQHHTCSASRGGEKAPPAVLSQRVALASSAPSVEAQSPGSDRSCSRELCGMEGGTAQPRAPSCRCALGFVPSQLAAGAAVQEGLFLASSVPVTEDLQWEGGKKAGRAQRGRAGLGSSPHGTQKHGRAQKGRDPPPGSRSPHRSHLHTHTLLPIQHLIPSVTKPQMRPKMS